MKWLFVQSIVLALLVALAAGQGLKRRSGLAASNEGSKKLAAQYTQQFAAAQSLAANYRKQSGAEKAKCAGGKDRAALCASNAGTSRSDDDAAILALGPAEFSWLSPPGGRGGDVLAMINPFGPVRDQGECATCVSFAVAAAAEAAVARTLGLGGGVVRLSVQDLAFCPVVEGDVRFCPTPTEAEAALSKVTSQMIVAEDCLRYDTRTLTDDEKKCSYSCARGDPRAQQGRFSVRLLNTLAKAQRHLRRYGGVITTMAIYKDFREFFRANPTGVYDGKGCQKGDDFLEDHAVVLVGYNNKEGYWVVRNSWGKGFADGGYFRIKYGVCGLGSPTEMWGLTWMPNQGVKIPYDVSKDAQNPGCYIYRARAGDSISSLADIWGVDAFELLYNNSASIEDVSKPLEGTVLSVCGISSNNVDLKTPTWVLSDTIKPSFNPTGEKKSSTRSRSTATTERGSTGRRRLTAPAKFPGLL